MTDETITGRVFNILELACFPKGCKIEEESQPYLATVTVPQLEAAGMTVTQWTRGAQMLEEPFLSQVKNVVCRRCMHFECEHNSSAPQGWTGDILNDITQHGYGERQQANVDLAATLIPKKFVEDSKALGIIIQEPFVVSSRTRVHMSVTVQLLENRKITVCLERKKGQKGEICVYGTSSARYPMPNTANQVAAKLQEIIIFSDTPENGTHTNTA